MTPGQIFRSAVRRANIMTPHVMRYQHVGHKIVVELSKGQVFLTTSYMALQ